MRRPRVRKTWLAIDLAIVLWLGVMIVDTAGGFDRSSGPEVGSISLVRTGMRLALPEVRWPAARDTVVLFVSPSCWACVASIDLFVDLSRRVFANPHVRLVALGQEPKPTTGLWLEGHQIGVDQVLHLDDPGSLGLYGTPTILVLDGEGVVEVALSGLLQPSQIERIYQHIDDGEHSRMSNVPELIDREELRALAAAGQVQVLDGRNRADVESRGRSGILNIPFDELEARAPLELLTTQPVVLRCVETSPQACAGYGTLLRQLGFTGVYLIQQD